MKIKAEWKDVRFVFWIALCIGFTLGLVVGAWMA